MLNDKDYEQIIPYLWGIKKDEWIIPGELVKKFGFSVEDICIVLASLAEIGVTTVQYAPLCSKCGYPIGWPVDNMEDLSGDECCEKCGDKIDIENTVVIFKKTIDTITGDEYKKQKRAANRKAKRHNQTIKIIH